jgi:hypothetical protein
LYGKTVHNKVFPQSGKTILYGWLRSNARASILLISSSAILTSSRYPVAGFPKPDAVKNHCSGFTHKESCPHGEPACI